MSLAWNGQEIAGLALNGSAVSACYNGQIVWPTEQIPVTRYEYKLWVTPDGSGKSAGTLPSALSAFDSYIVAYGLHTPSFTRQYQTFPGTGNDVTLFGLFSDRGTGRWGYYMSESRFSSNATNWTVVNNTGSCNWWMDTRANQNGGWNMGGYPNRLKGVYEIIGVKYQ
jgi:hypothetical protein